MTRFNANKHRRDDNHKSIVALLRSYPGAKVDDVSQLSGLGYDLLVHYRKQVRLVEVKDGAKPPSERKLSESEKKARAEHFPIWVLIESENDARKMMREMG